MLDDAVGDESPVPRYGVEAAFDFTKTACHPSLTWYVFYRVTGFTGILVYIRIKRTVVVSALASVKIEPDGGEDAGKLIRLPLNLVGISAFKSLFKRMNHRVKPLLVFFRKALFDAFRVHN